MSDEDLSLKTISWAVYMACVVYVFEKSKDKATTVRMMLAFDLLYKTSLLIETPFDDIRVGFVLAATFFAWASLNNRVPLVIELVRCGCLFGSVYCLVS